MNAPVSVMETAGEGGAWGIALLASYMVNKEEGETLAHYLAQKKCLQEIQVQSWRTGPRRM